MGIDEIPRRRFERPTVTKPEGPAKGYRSDEVVTHPAFAQIGAYRISGNGGGGLYGSDFNHQHSIRIEITRSELHRSLSNDWHHPRDSLIVVELSEAQWAQFVSSLNMGSGACCTLRRLPGDDIPLITLPEPRSEQFGAEMAKAMTDSLAALAEADRLIGELKISEKARKELAGALDAARSRMLGTTEFVAKQFDEHMETTVEKAKGEISAHMQHVNNHLAKLGAATLRELGYQLPAADGKLLGGSDAP